MAPGRESDSFFAAWTGSYPEAQLGGLCKVPVTTLDSTFLLRA